MWHCMLAAGGTLAARVTGDLTVKMVQYELLESHVAASEGCFYFTVSPPLMPGPRLLRWLSTGYAHKTAM